MRRITAASLALVLLSGCAAENIAKGINPMMGQPIDHLYAKLGYPDGETTIVGRHAYVWSSQSAGVMPLYTPTTTTGFVGTVPFNMTTGGMSMLPFQSSCQIRVFVDGQDIITGWDLKGNQDGCAAYARRLGHTIF